MTAPWAREGSRFTLLFEQAAARIIGITDKRLWRIVEHYAGRAVGRLDLGKLAAAGLDETAARRGQTSVTMFIDLDHSEKPVVFVTPGRGKDMGVQFRAFLAEYGGCPGRIAEVVCDMSGAFIAAVGESFENAALTVDSFLVVQLFTKAVDEVRRAEARQKQAAQSAALGRPEAGRRSPH
jgi:transposase